MAAVYCSSQTSPAHILQKLSQSCLLISTNTGRVYRPKEAERMILYLKDINLPKPDKWATSQLIAFLQQVVHFLLHLWSLLMESSASILEDLITLRQDLATSSCKKRLNVGRKFQILFSKLRPGILLKWRTLYESCRKSVCFCKSECLISKMITVFVLENLSDTSFFGKVPRTVWKIEIEYFQYFDASAECNVETMYDQRVFRHYVTLFNFF